MPRGTWVSTPPACISTWSSVTAIVPSLVAALVAASLQVYQPAGARILYAGMVQVVLLLPVAFLAGLATALSPCILPVLPLVLGSATGPGRRRPLGIVLGVAGGFCLLTLAAAALAAALGLPPVALRWLAAVAVAISGATLLVPALDKRLAARLGRLVAPLAAGPRRAKAGDGSGFAGGVLAGLGAGLLWT